jgi:hypothetical protein
LSIVDPALIKVDITTIFEIVARSNRNVVKEEFKPATFLSDKEYYL